MNAFKKNLHIWIVAASLTAFLTGWGFLAHAPKSGIVQTANVATTQTVTSQSPLQFIENLLNIQPRSRTHRTNSTSSLRTGGS
jgi:hypothetical protein